VEKIQTDQYNWRRNTECAKFGTVWNKHLHYELYVNQKNIQGRLCQALFPKEIEKNFHNVVAGRKADSRSVPFSARKECVILRLYSASCNKLYIYTPIDKRSIFPR